MARAARDNHLIYFIFGGLWSSVRVAFSIDASLFQTAQPPSQVSFFTDAARVGAALGSTAWNLFCNRLCQNSCLVVSGRNIINPALAARVFLSIIAPASMRVYPKPHQHLPAFSINVSAKVAKSPLAALAAGELPEESVYSMLVGEVAGAIGGVSALLLAAGFIYVLIRRTVSSHIPATYLATVAVIALSFPKSEAVFFLPSTKFYREGLVLIAIFMATNVVTTPLTSIGKIIFGAGCGALTMLLRYYRAYEEGAACAVLIMNLLVYIIDRLTMPSIFGGKKGAHWRE